MVPNPLETRFKNKVNFRYKNKLKILIETIEKVVLTQLIKNAKQEEVKCHSCNWLWHCRYRRVERRRDVMRSGLQEGLSRFPRWRPASQGSGVKRQSWQKYGPY